MGFTIIYSKSANESTLIDNFYLSGLLRYKDIADALDIKKLIEKYEQEIEKGERIVRFIKDEAYEEKPPTKIEQSRVLALNELERESLKLLLDTNMIVDFEQILSIIKTTFHSSSLFKSFFMDAHSLIGLDSEFDRFIDLIYDQAEERCMNGVRYSVKDKIFHDHLDALADHQVDKQKKIVLDEATILFRKLKVAAFVLLSSKNAESYEFFRDCSIQAIEKAKLFLKAEQQLASILDRLYFAIHNLGFNYLQLQEKDSPLSRAKSSLLSEEERYAFVQFDMLTNLVEDLQNKKNPHVIKVESLLMQLRDVLSHYLQDKSAVNYQFFVMNVDEVINQAHLPLEELPRMQEVLWNIDFAIKGLGLPYQARHKLVRYDTARNFLNLLIDFEKRITQFKKAAITPEQLSTSKLLERLAVDLAELLPSFSLQGSQRYITISFACILEKAQAAEVGKLGPDWALMLCQLELVYTCLRLEGDFWFLFKDEKSFPGRSALRNEKDWLALAMKSPMTEYEKIFCKQLSRLDELAVELRDEILEDETYEKKAYITQFLLMVMKITTVVYLQNKNERNYQVLKEIIEYAAEQLAPELSGSKEYVACLTTLCSTLEKLNELPINILKAGGKHPIFSACSLDAAKRNQGFLSQEKSTPPQSSDMNL